MKKGETIIIPFKCNQPFDVSLIHDVIFTIKGSETIEKIYPDDINFSDNTFWLGFTQEETEALAGEAGSFVEIEAQFNYINKNVLKSAIERFFLNNTLGTHIVNGNTPSVINLPEISFSIENGVVVAKVDGEIDPAMVEEAVNTVIAGKNYATLSEVNTEIETYIDVHKSELKGEKGDRGEQGAQGLKGDKGDKGDTGEVDYSRLENYYTKAEVDANLDATKSEFSAEVDEINSRIDNLPKGISMADVEAKGYQTEAQTNALIDAKIEALGDAESEAY